MNYQAQPHVDGCRRSWQPQTVRKSSLYSHLQGSVASGTIKGILRETLPRTSGDMAHTTIPRRRRVWRTRTLPVSWTKSLSTSSQRLSCSANLFALKHRLCCIPRAANQYTRLCEQNARAVAPGAQGESIAHNDRRQRTSEHDLGAYLQIPPRSRPALRSECTRPSTLKAAP